MMSSSWRAERNWSVSWLWGLVVVGLLLRVGVVAVRSSELSHDRDAYLGIAQGVVAGRGYSSAGSTEPTAYRSPLYPLLLAPISGPEQGWLRGWLQIALGGATVGLTYLAAWRILDDRRGSLMAAGLVAIDPLLLAYTPQMMTETLATFLAAAILAASVGDPRTWSRRRQVGVGLVLGLAVLCRPTFLVFAAALVVWTVWQVVLRPKPEGLSSSVMSRFGGLPWIALLVAGLTIAPWPIRNALRFGTPIVTTTHGGYTLLLSNNPVYHDEIVRAPWGTVWQGKSLERWQREQQLELDARGIRGEVAQDQWWNARAREWIRLHPTAFLTSCGHRLLSFWKLAPAQAEGSPGLAVQVAVGAFYFVEWGLVLAGLLAAWRMRSSSVVPLLLLIGCFTAMHCVYFSNARMRAPLVPALAVLSAMGAGLRTRPSQ